MGHLKRRVNQERLDRKEALAYVRGDAMNFLERTLAFASADGIITEEEEHFIQTCVEFWTYRVRCETILDRLVIKRSSAISAPESAKNQTRQGAWSAARGEMLYGCFRDLSQDRIEIDFVSSRRLVASSKRLRFFLSDRIFEIDWTQIIEVERRSNGIYLEARQPDGQRSIRCPGPHRQSRQSSTLWSDWRPKSHWYPTRSKPAESMRI